MILLEICAFCAKPIVAVAIGYAAMQINERSVRLHQEGANRRPVVRPHDAT